ncbi:MAG: hypothetical protein R6X02_21640 [Enhygromyxa sp.]
MTEHEAFARAPALLISALMIAVTLWPLSWERGRDSFPLSPYPMFSTIRERPWIDVIVGFDAAGNEHRIGPELIANAEVMQAAQTVSKAIRRRQARGLCEQVAARVAKRPNQGELVRLEVQSRQFDPRTYFVSDAGKVPLRLRRRASCEVAR